MKKNDRGPRTGRNFNGRKKVDPRVFSSPPPRLYCDSAEVIHVVPEVDGSRPSLRRGDHCMIPLNLALGQNEFVDSFVDLLADFELIQFSHHFIVLNDVLKDTMENTFVAEFTNNPELFLKKAEAVGFSGAFMDKAAFMKTPLQAYKGRLVFKVVEEEPLTEAQRDAIVESALEALDYSQTGHFQKYNVLLENCEHATTELINRGKRIAQQKKPQLQLQPQKPKPRARLGAAAASSADARSPGEGSAGLSAGSPIDAPAREQPLHRRSPQAEFAGWNTMRFGLQIVGACFLHFIKSGWTWAVASYILLCVAPVAMQSSASFGLAVRRVRGLFVSGTIDGPAFRHLWLKEMFRWILVGVGSTALMSLAPLAVYGEFVSPVVAGCLSLSVFIFTNTLYSVLAQGVHRLFLAAQDPAKAAAAAQQHERQALSSRKLKRSSARGNKRGVKRPASIDLPVVPSW